MSRITTHVLDTARGQPASGVPVTLEVEEGGSFREVGRGETDDDGRLKTLTPEGALRAGTWRITFETAAYHARHGVEGFFPRVSIVFTVKDAAQHFHVPLLLSPFGYSTYRGS